VKIFKIAIFGHFRLNFDEKSPLFARFSNKSSNSMAPKEAPKRAFLTSFRVISGGVLQRNKRCRNVALTCSLTMNDV
jgi:hypothetical protein